MDAWFLVGRRGRGPAGVARPRPQALSSAVVWVVRRDWPDGMHEFVRACGSQPAAVRQLMADQRYWRPGPMRPRLSIVRISRHEFRLHGRYRRDCRAPDCPQSVPAAAEAVW